MPGASICSFCPEGCPEFWAELWPEFWPEFWEELWGADFEDGGALESKAVNLGDAGGFV
jgi:hypothetical protein